MSKTRQAPSSRPKATQVIDAVSAQAGSPSRVPARGRTFGKGWFVNVRGVVFVEYTVLIGAVALAGSVALVVVGAAVVHNFDFVRGVLLCPIP